jgi:hypothetical protein|tara:strand:- start:2734 stop:3135 length:402 start_codon:yes stop_codon:yes gene_type:complete
MLQGKHPQTGMDVQEWGCSIAWIPLLLVENSQQILGTTAATESFRNEMVQSNNIMTKVLAQSSDAKRAMATATSIFELIGDHQKAIDTKDKNLEDNTILQLSNNKVKVKDKPKKVSTKKVKKDGNNRKQHNRK